MLIMLVSVSLRDSDLVPALQHDVVESRRTALRLLHPEPVLHLVQHLQHTVSSEARDQEENISNYLGIGHPWVGNSAKGYELGQKDSKTPHIRFDGESEILE